MSRLSYSGSEAFERKLDDALRSIAEAFAALPQSAGCSALILGGGYGRGEGGATDCDRPANDLDFFVLTEVGGENAVSLRAACGELGGIWAEKLGIDVDFSLISRRELLRNAQTLMIQELLAGHRVLWGGEDALDFVPRLDFELLHWREGARLLLNRGAGLVLARRRLGEADSGTPEARTFIRRNLHKAALGMGDALLIAAHGYRRRGIERREEVGRLFPAFAGVYRAALEYKYHPCEEGSEDFGLWLTQSSGLFREAMRVFACEVFRLDAATAEEAAKWMARGDEPARGMELLRVLALNMLYMKALPCVRPLAVHPRLKVPLLLAPLLAAENRMLEERFLMLWRRFN